MSSDILRISGYDQSNMEVIANVLGSGGVVIMPCDTIYGFVAKRSQESRVRRIKHRDDKPFLYLISDIEMLRYFDIDETAYRDILRKNWPGNITFIMNNIERTSTFGLRMPDHDALLNIIRRMGEPLLSTSVNISGHSAINDPNEIIATFGEDADMIVADDTYIPSAASTIVDLTAQPYNILRQGERIFAY